ncbi:hypothetical protein SAMN06272789_0736 [Streptomyces sp. 1331.2]|nr:hypothetical protein SAMN06272789_0736 [Streptomyces sp. 1331.2]
MARVRLWGYVASGARVLGAIGAIGTIGGTAGGPGRRGGSGRAGGPATAEAEDGTGPFQPGGMAAPRALTRTELERLGWTDRQAGCEPTARHVQVADVLRRVIRGGDRSAAVTVRVAPGLPVVTGDARRLEAAVAGLVDHAIRRSRPGGRVLVRADVARGRRARRAPGGRPPGAGTSPGTPPGIPPWTPPATAGSGPGSAPGVAPAPTAPGSAAGSRSGYPTVATTSCPRPANGCSPTCGPTARWDRPCTAWSWRRAAGSRSSPPRAAA